LSESYVGMVMTVEGAISPQDLGTNMDIRLPRARRYSIAVWPRRLVGILAYIWTIIE
jgi:hypothetical protein